MFRFLSVLSLVWLCMLPAHAETTNPKQVVESVSDVVLAKILANKEELEKGPKFLLNLVEDHMMPIIDQELMSKLALGKYWESISDKQKKAFAEGFKRLLIKTYAGAFKSYTGQEVTYGEVRYNKSKDKAIVTSDIHVAGGAPVNLQYRLYEKTPSQWLVYDANIAGLGLVRTYRAQFSDQIAKDGVDAMIAQLTSVEL